MNGNVKQLGIAVSMTICFYF